MQFALNIQNICLSITSITDTILLNNSKKMSWESKRKRRKKEVECETERWMHNWQDVFQVNTWVLTCGVKFMRGGDWCLVALRLFVRGMVLTENTSCPVHTHKWKTVTISATSCYSYPNALDRKCGSTFKRSHSNPLSKNRPGESRQNISPTRCKLLFSVKSMIYFKRLSRHHKSCEQNCIFLLPASKAVFRKFWKLFEI